MKLNLLEILKDAPKGTKLWSPLFGEVEFKRLTSNTVEIIDTTGITSDFWADGRYYSYCKDAECLLFPSRKNRDWSTIKAPKPKPNFKPKQWVLVRDDEAQEWRLGIFSHIKKGELRYVTTGISYKYCIPFEGNEELLGTTDKPKE